MPRPRLGLELWRPWSRSHQIYYIVYLVSPQVNASVSGLKVSVLPWSRLKRCRANFLSVGLEFCNFAYIMIMFEVMEVHLCFFTCRSFPVIKTCVNLTILQILFLFKNQERNWSGCILFKNHPILWRDFYCNYRLYDVASFYWCIQQ